MKLLDRVLSCPKAELHLHIEGSLEPELAFALAQRNHINFPFASVESLRAAYNFSNLQSFLDLYYACADVLRTEEDFHDLMLAYLRRAAVDGVVHAEIMFDPQTHTARGIPMATVINGLRAGIATARDESGINAALILSFLRHLSEEDAFTTLREAEPHLQHVAAFGLDSSEMGHPPSKFERVYAACRDLGKPVVAHAGEEGPPAYVFEALDLLKVNRIDHGVRCVEDPALVKRLAAEQIPLTVCPLSNVRLCVFKEMAQHTLPAMLAANLCVTLNSDDPAYFGGYLGNNLRAVQAAFNFDAPTWARIFRNSFNASFISAEQKAAWCAKVDSHMLG